MSRTFRNLMLLAVMLGLDKRLGPRCRIVLVLLFLFVAPSCRAFAADASITVFGSETLLSSGWGSGSIIISFGDSAGKTYRQTVVYGQYSTPASIASAFGARFSNTYYPLGLLCAHAEGAVIYFHLNGTASFNALRISNPSVSFSLIPFSGWPHLTISYIAPNAASVGAAVTIIGTEFSSSQGSSTVTFNGILATVSSWGNTSISAIVPTGATSGSVVVTMSGVASNGVAFTVLGTSPQQLPA
jgi:IPT/TIG domain